MYLIALVLAAVQFLASLDFFTTESFRIEPPEGFSATNPFHLEHLIMLISPNFLGNLDYSAVPYWGNENYVTQSVFIGAAACFLFIWGILKRAKQEFFIILIIVVLFVIALGNNTPLFKFTIRYLPFFNGFNSAV